MKTAVVEIINSAPAVLAGRSRLYHLEPVHQINGLVESLTSYIARLAAAHCLPLWILIKRELTPLFECQSVVTMNDISKALVGNLGSAVNGNNNTARETLKIVEQLTARSGLGDLTMVTAENYLSSTPLIRPIQSWCPQCLEEWSASEQILHYPLLWNLASVHACPVHEIRLHNVCPRCGRSHHPLAAGLRIGRCPRCGSWLGMMGRQQPSAELQGERPTAWQIYAANTATTLLANLASNWQARANDRSFFAGNVSRVVNHAFAGHGHAFAKFMRITYYTVFKWCRETQRPSLNSILVLSYRLGVPASELILGPLDVEKVVPRWELGESNELRLRPFLRSTVRDQIEQTLRATIQKDLSPPPSLRSVCVKAGFQPNHVSRRFPELSRQISDRYKLYMLEKRRKSGQSLKHSIRSAVIEFHAAGIYPSMKKLEKKLALNIPRSFRAERAAAMRDCGLAVRPRRY
jgi:hypothetical protein